MLVSVATLALAVAVAFGILVGVGLGERAFEGAALLAVGGAVWLGASHVGAWPRRQGRLSRQYSLSVLIAVVLGFVVVWLTARLMVVSTHDAEIFAALLAFVGIVGGRSAGILARRNARDLAALTSGLGAIADGNLAHRVDARGAEELRSVAESVNWLAAELERAHGARAQSEEARRSLVAAISHDLRTPLTALRLLVDAVADGVIAPSGMDEAVAGMDRHLRVLGVLVEDLFELARMDAGDVRWERPALDLREVLEETAEAFRPQAAAAGIEIVVAIAGSLPAVYASASRIERVLGNLIGNAIRYAPGARLVQARGESPTPDSVLISIEDDGAGIPFADHERVFERFWRGAAERPSGGGSGLGLPICRAIVEAHGGEIWIDRDRTAGTAVRFRLPTGPPTSAEDPQRAGAGS